MSSRSARIIDNADHYPRDQLHENGDDTVAHMAGVAVESAVETASTLLRMGGATARKALRRTSVAAGMSTGTSRREVDPTMSRSRDHGVDRNDLGSPRSEEALMAAAVAAQDDGTTERTSVSLASLKDRASTAIRDASIRVTFTQQGPLGLKFTLNRLTQGVEVLAINPGTQATNHPELQPGLILREVSGELVAGMSYKQVLGLLKAAGRPVRLVFEHGGSVERASLLEQIEDEQQLTALEKETEAISQAEARRSRIESDNSRHKANERQALGRQQNAEQQEPHQQPSVSKKMINGSVRDEPRDKPLKMMKKPTKQAGRGASGAAAQGTVASKRVRSGSIAARSAMNLSKEQIAERKAMIGQWSAARRTFEVGLSELPSGPEQQLKSRVLADAKVAAADKSLDGMRAAIALVEEHLQARPTVPEPEPEPEQRELHSRNLSTLPTIPSADTHNSRIVAGEASDSSVTTDDKAVVKNAEQQSSGSTAHNKPVAPLRGSTFQRNEPLGDSGSDTEELAPSISQRRASIAAVRRKAERRAASRPSPSPESEVLSSRRNSTASFPGSRRSEDIRRQQPGSSHRGSISPVGTGFSSNYDTQSEQIMDVLTRTMAELGEERGRLSQLQDEKMELVQRLAKAEAAAAIVDHLKSDLATAQSQLGEMQRLCDKLKVEVANADKEKELALRTHSEADSTRQRLQAELAGERTKTAQAQRDITLAAEVGNRSDCTLAAEREHVVMLRAELTTMHDKLEAVTTSEQKAVRELAATIREHAREAAEMELMSARNELEKSRSTSSIAAKFEEGSPEGHPLHEQLHSLRSEVTSLQQLIHTHEQSAHAAQKEATVAKRQLQAAKEAAAEVSTLSASAETELQNALNDARTDANRARTEAASAMLQMDTQRKRWEALVAEARVEAQNEREAREEAEDCSRRSETKRKDLAERTMSKLRRSAESKSEAASLAKSALAQAQEQWRAKEKQLQTMLNLEVATRQMAEQRLQEQDQRVQDMATSERALRLELDSFRIKFSAQLEARARGWANVQDSDGRAYSAHNTSSDRWRTAAELPSGLLSPDDKLASSTPTQADKVRRRWADEAKPDEKEQHERWMAAKQRAVVAEVSVNRAAGKSTMLVPPEQLPHSGAELVGKWLQVESPSSRGTGPSAKPRRGYVLGYESARGRLQVAWDDSIEPTWHDHGPLEHSQSTMLASPTFVPPPTATRHTLPNRRMSSSVYLRRDAGDGAMND